MIPSGRHNSSHGQNSGHRVQNRTVDQISIFEYITEMAVYRTLFHQFKLPWRVHRYTSYNLLSSSSCSDFSSFWELAYHGGLCWSDCQCSNLVFNSFPGSIGMVTMRIRYQITFINITFINIAKTLSPLHPGLSLLTYMGPMNPIYTIT